jgi:hypothetical protein
MPLNSTRMAVSALTLALLTLALALAAPAGASTTYGVRAGTWSKHFSFNGCQMRVKWGVEGATGVARVRFYTRSLARCRSAARAGAGPGWMGAASDGYGAIAVVMPGTRQPGAHKDACGSYVEWKASLAKISGLQVNLVNSGHLKNPYFRVASGGRALPHAHAC